MKGRNKKGEATRGKDKEMGGVRGGRMIRREECMEEMHKRVEGEREEGRQEGWRGDDMEDGEKIATL